MYSFSYDVFPPGTFQPWLANTRVSAGTTLNGVGQDADWSGGGFWSLEMTGFSVRTEEQHLEWLGLCTEVGDGFTTLIVPANIGPFYPDGGGDPAAMSFHADADANLSATSIDIKIVTGGPIKRGHRFGLEHALAGPRSYSIRSVEDLGNGVCRCKFKPPLREAALANAAIDFFNPRIVMKVKSAGKDMWPKIVPPYKAAAQILLVEDFSYQNDIA